MQHNTHGGRGEEIRLSKEEAIDILVEMVMSDMWDVYLKDDGTTLVMRPAACSSDDEDNVFAR